MTEARREQIRRTEALLERGEKRGLKKGLKQGLQRGLKKGLEQAAVPILRQIYEQRLGRMPAALDQALSGGAADIERAVNS